MAASSLPDSSLALLQGVCDDIAATGSASDRHWKLLAFLCPEALQGAAEIVDHRTVQRVVAQESRRVFHLVSASSGSKRAHPHVCLPSFCTCASYCHKVATRSDALACKHGLAVLLAEALRRTQSAEHSDVAWANSLSHHLQLAMIDHGSH
mmetsp:Transcript_16210/g.51753  ORF Transcript_16210/g.51753 Transcript_16210/m.51753 type:complete len:151 (+) Transcript_16210:34-486(+)